MRKLTSMLVCFLLCGSCALAQAESFEQGVPQEKYVGEITAEVMLERVNKAEEPGVLYIKYEENKVLVFKDLESDKAACTQIIFASPNETMLQVYSNNKKAFQQLYKAFGRNKGPWRLVDGYELVGEKNPVEKLPNEEKLYRFWYKKVEPAPRSRRVRSRSRFPIGIGIGIGRHSRHGHAGIGIGL